MKSRRRFELVIIHVAKYKISVSSSDNVLLYKYTLAPYNKAVPRRQSMFNGRRLIIVTFENLLPSLLRSLSLRLFINVNAVARNIRHKAHLSILSFPNFDF